MVKRRKAEERASANYGWLGTHGRFSFADYYDPERLGFRTLRVINDEQVPLAGAALRPELTPGYATRNPQHV